MRRRNGDMPEEWHAWRAALVFEIVGLRGYDFHIDAEALYKVSAESESGKSLCIPRFPWNTCQNIGKIANRTPLTRSMPPDPYIL